MSKKVYFIADPHGNYRIFRDLYERNKERFNKEKPVLIILGDAGFNFFLTGHRDRDLKEKLGKYPFTYFVIRGNHEWRPQQMNDRAPQDWNIDTFFDNTVWVEKDFPYIKYAVDWPAVYNINGYKTLIVPGAYSVDKDYRIARGWTWNEKEQLSEKEREEGLKLIEEYNCTFDLILSHTTDLENEPIDLFMPSVDQTKVDKTMELYLSEIKNKCQYKAALWGHYHKLRDYFWETSYDAPSHEHPRELMVFNNYAVELEDILKNKDIFVF